MADDIGHHIESHSVLSSVRIGNAVVGVVFEQPSRVVAVVLDSETENVMDETVIDEVHFNLASVLLFWVRDFGLKHRVNVVAVGVCGRPYSAFLASSFWLQDDIVPFFFTHARGTASRDQALNCARDVCTWFNKDQWASDRARVFDTEMASLVLGPLHNSPYRHTVDAESWTQLNYYADVFKKQNNRLIFVNSTRQGGGVALMRHAVIRICRLLSLDVHWHIEEPDQKVFAITKRKFHNTIQGVNTGDLEKWRLTEEDKQLYINWSKHNAELLEPVLKSAKVMVVDDPQPAGMIPFVKKYNPAVKIIYRSHIHLETETINKPGTVLHDTWNFIWSFAGQADLVLSHPIREFVPACIPPEKVLFAPATTDPFDGLNKPMSHSQIEFYIQLFNRYLLNTGQRPLNLSRPSLVQIARFDPSKGIPDVIAAYALLVDKLKQNGRESQVPQLILAGHGSVDDPEGQDIWQSTLDLVRTKFAQLANDVKVARLPNKDQILNVLARISRVGFQLSIREGFEVKVTELLMKGIPMVVYRTGGIPLQVLDGVTGYVVDCGRADLAAERAYELFTNDRLHNSMRTAAMERCMPEFTTVPNVASYLYLATQLAAGVTVPGDFEYVSTRRKAHYAQLRADYQLQDEQLVREVEASIRKDLHAVDATPLTPQFGKRGVKAL